MATDYGRLLAFYQTASFWSGELAGVKQFQLSHLDLSHLKESPDSINLPDIPAETVLGKRAESFFQFCVEQSSNYNVILANEQIFRGKATIGELDFILEERASKKLIHVELVYKFYIYEPSKQYRSDFLSAIQNFELAHYVGPNRRDYFIKKLDHLISKQLPLLYKPETQERLSQLGIFTDNIEQQICFLAHVFIPQTAWQNDFKYLNKKSIVGYYVDEYAFAKAKTSNKYYIPQKKEWKLQPQELAVSYNHKEVLDLTSSSLKRGFAPMIWMQWSNGDFESFFIVSTTK
ncbi:DUF1853 family protein [Nonlabens antarcticus]|uniref:DUF1853 family protein n=1 Tax=Nonlabens antarcticus TaxID=392714 RepID=UPI00189139C8|nr:DUF1853 family protein [Nonlabens antarcticus]